jgi:hypothetical protein
VRALLSVAACAAAAGVLMFPKPGRKIVRFAPGVTEVHYEIAIEGGSDVSGGTLHAAADFRGRAVLAIRGDGVRVHDMVIDGNREALEVRSGLPPSDVPFEKFTRANGILAAGVSGLDIQRVRFNHVAGFAVLASRSRGVTIERAAVSDSGSRNTAGRNNTTGGILFEEGSIDFRVTHSEFRNVRGNGVWTHSLYTSPRNARGVIAFNVFQELARDAIQVGHATGVRVEGNRGTAIGFPEQEVDIENLAVPVGIDTAGNVDRCEYIGNTFDSVSGKCIDLDGLHDGSVTGNTCRDLGNFGIVMNNSNPDMQSRNIRISGNTIQDARFGGIFVIGSGHWIAGNRLLNLDTARIAGPDLLHSGIFLARGAARPDPARGNVIENNEISGFEMTGRCVAFEAGVDPAANTIRGNGCK